MNLLPPGSRRIVLTTLTVAGLVLVTAPTASAHVEASAEGAQAGAGPVVVAFLVEAESSTAGITGVKTQLPEHLPPSSVSLASGPDGWALSPTADGYEIAGPAIATGVDAEFSISVAQLPADAAEVHFKTLVRYSDGSEDAWIELPTADNPEPENPAPVIAVAPAAVTAAPTTASTPTSTPAVSSSSEAPATATPAAAASTVDDDSSSTGLVVGIVVAAAALAGAGFWFLRRRSSRAS